MPVRPNGLKRGNLSFTHEFGTELGRRFVGEKDAPGVMTLKQWVNDPRNILGKTRKRLSESPPELFPRVFQDFRAISFHLLK